jgi:hypothetical protein
VARPIDLQSPSSFDPEALVVLYQAFDDVWLQLEEATPPDLREATWNTIARALLQAAMAGERDPEKLWCHAMSRARALSTLYSMFGAKQEPLSPTLPKNAVRFFAATAQSALTTRRRHPWT